MANQIELEESLGNNALCALASTEISLHATRAWARIPPLTKAEIIAAIEHSAPANADNAGDIEIGNQIFKVRKTATGFRTIYEERGDRNIVVAVLTPREGRYIYSR